MYMCICGCVRVFQGVYLYRVVDALQRTLTVLYTESHSQKQLKGTLKALNR